MLEMYSLSVFLIGSQLKTLWVSNLYLCRQWTRIEAEGEDDQQPTGIVGNLIKRSEKKREEKRLLNYSSHTKSLLFDVRSLSTRLYTFCPMDFHE